ncbi:MAG: hypothetical protein R2750_04100 [Bacteroidales bacterium]
MYKSLIVLMTVAFIGSGIKAQYDVAPNLTTQLEETEKPSKPEIKLKNINLSLNPFSDVIQGFEPTSKDGHKQSAIYWRQDRNMGNKPTFIKPNPTDNLFDLQFSWPVGVGVAKPELKPMETTFTPPNGMVMNFTGIKWMEPSLNPLPVEVPVRFVTLPGMVPIFMVRQPILRYIKWILTPKRL